MYGMPPSYPFEITLIAALSAEGVIGTERGGIPWSLPRDAAHFRRQVAGKALLLGRKTYEEMRGWFRDEHPIVLSASAAFRPNERDVRTAGSLDAALAVAASGEANEIMVCGGASVYALTLPVASKMILTHVAASPENTPETPRFPSFYPADWRIAREEFHPADAENAHAIRMAWYERRVPG